MQSLQRNKEFVLLFVGIDPFATKLFNILLSIYGMLVRLPGEFMSGQVIAFSVSRGGSGMRVGGEVV
jgi:hypothetical protein